MQIYTYRSGHKTLKRFLSITLSLLVLVQMTPAAFVVNEVSAVDKIDICHHEGNVWAFMETPAGTSLDGHMGHGDYLYTGPAVDKNSKLSTDAADLWCGEHVPQPPVVIVNKTLTTNVVGNGSITSSPAGINCGGDCSEIYNSTTTVALTATPATGSHFVSWTGDCTGTGSCSVTMSTDRSVTATFALDTFPLDAAVNGDGIGTVTSDVGTISCLGDCSDTYKYGDSVTLTATPAIGSVFAGWGGACSGTLTTCTVSISAATNVTATFNLIPPPDQVTLTAIISGNGSVASSPVGIDCGLDCSENYNVNSVVVLTATAASESEFVSWSNCDSAVGNVCTQTLETSETVTANFRVSQVNDPSVNLGITKSVNDSTPDEGQTLVYSLTVTNSGPDAATNVVVADLLPAGLTFVSASSTVGTYASSTGNWIIGSLANGDTALLDITVTVNSSTAGQTITNTTSADGSENDPVAENNTASASVVINTPEQNPQRFTLDVTITGDGTGSVTGNGIDCVSGEASGDCQETYVAGTVVNITATANEGSNFDNSWTIGGGTCTGNNTPCSVTINSNVSLSAHFGLNQNTTTTSGGGGSHRSGGGGIVLGINNDTPQGQVLGATFEPGLPATGNGPINSDSTNTLAVLFAGLIVLVGLNLASFKALKLEVK